MSRAKSTRRTPDRIDRALAKHRRAQAERMESLVDSTKDSIDGLLRSIRGKRKLAEIANDLVDYIEAAMRAALSRRRRGGR